jgi:hypothetical protein
MFDARAPGAFAEMSAVNQEAVIEMEEMIARSEWRVAQSRRLLERLQAALPLTYRTDVR